MGPGMKYLIDTNILIYYFNGSLSASAKEKITAILNDDFNISVISKMEFLGFNRFDSREKQEFWGSGLRYCSYWEVKDYDKRNNQAADQSGHYPYPSGYGG
jgi:hypothetical protein